MPSLLCPALQVTNPAIDPFREAVVTSLRCFIGPEGDITTCAPSHAKRLELAQPILTLHEMAAMKIINAKKWKAKVGLCRHGSTTALFKTFECVSVVVFVSCFGCACLQPR
jgi:hypothetical protein